MSTSEERIRKLREEVDSLRTLLDRTQSRRESIGGKSDKKDEKLSISSKFREKMKRKTEDDIPPF